MSGAAKPQSAPTAPWVCPACGASRSTRFCSACGEKPIAPRDLTLRGIIALMFAALSPVDGRVMLSFRTLVMRPGGLTVAFQRGLRKPYIGPFQIFLLANVIFFAVQTAGSMRVFTQPLAQRLTENEFLSSTSRNLVEAHLVRIGQSMAEYTPFFDQSLGVHAKSLIGLMVPPFALLIPLVFWRRAQPIAVDVVFSLHFYTFLLLLFCVPLGLMEVSALLGGPAAPPSWLDDVFSYGLLLGCAAYLYAAIGPVYGSSGVTRFAQTLVLLVMVTVIFLAYRFLLLPITLYTT